MIARILGVVDLTSGAMLLALASGVGIVAPPIFGGFGTALAVGLAGALTLGIARRLPGAGWSIPVTASIARGAVIVGQVLVLLSQTGVGAVMAAAVVSLLLSVVLLTTLWVATLQARRT